MTFMRKTILALASLLFAGAALAADAVTYKEFTEGNPKAKVTVIEYASLTCPHCARFFINSYPTLKKDYIDKGKIQYIYRDFPTPPEQLSFAGALLARCAPGKNGLKVIEAIYKGQGEWYQDPEKHFRQYAKDAGIDDKAFDACLQNKELQEAMMASITKAATEFHISSTPSFLVNDTLVEGETWEPLRDAIDKALGVTKS